MVNLDGAAEMPERRQWDVALSFSGTDRAYVLRVASALKQRGVRCFYDADEQVELWGRHLVEELPRIFAEDCKVVVVFFSAAYASRDWTRLERRSALNRAVSEAREYVLPARFDDTPLPGLLSELVAIDLRPRTPEEFAATLIKKIDELGLFAHDSRTNDDAGGGGAQLLSEERPGEAAQVWSVPPRLTTFTGRESLLSAMHQSLSKARTVAVTTAASEVAALHGLGGVGKTQLAIEYAHRHAGEYELVWWVNAEQAELVGQQLATLADRLGLATSGNIPDDAALALTILKRRDDWLVIFDNASTSNDIRQWIPVGQGHVLITSRSPVWGAVAHRLEVDVLDRAETVVLLERRIEAIQPETAVALAAELGDLPLAVEQAAAYIEASGLSPGEYLE